MNSQNIDNLDLNIDNYSREELFKLFYGNYCSTLLNLSYNDNNMDLFIYVIYFSRTQS